MGFVKHGYGEVLPETDEQTKTASKAWSIEDEQELSTENDKADKE